MTAQVEPAPTDLDRLRAERDHVVAALIDAQDRLVALGDLLGVSAETLDEDEVVARLLSASLELTSSDAASFGATAVGTPDACAIRVQVTVDGDDRPLVLARDTGGPYTTGELRMAETVAAALGKLVRLARVHRQEVRRATVDREHRLASEMAQAALVGTAARAPGLDVYARCDPADVAGGDFVVHAVHGDVLWFAVGDAAGKGLPAAVTMTRAVSALHVAVLTHGEDDPGGAVVAVATALQDYLDAVDQFVTCVVGTVRAGGPLYLCNAGHSPVAHRAPGGGLAAILPSTPPLGLPIGAPRSVRLDFGPEALLVVGTDGLTEQMGPDGGMFGQDRMLALCARPERDAERLGEELFDAVVAYADGVPASDDRTLLVVRGSGA